MSAARAVGLSCKTTGAPAPPTCPLGNKPKRKYSAYGGDPSGARVDRGRLRARNACHPSVTPLRFLRAKMRGHTMGMDTVQVLGDAPPA
eukprot:6578849-Lingulodinium_polyedra.AAC.1